MSFAFVFPGQGAQAVGMLADLSDNEVVIETFSEASDVLGYDLWKLVQEGPAEELNKTDITQPAMLTAGVAIFRAIMAEKPDAQPEFMAGHSLGEYTALVASGSLSLAQGVELVAARGKLMQDAVPVGRGGMAAILGLEDAQVIEVCDKAAQGDIVEAVNFNSPGQVVIAGTKEAVDRAIEEAKNAGARRALPLPVSVPSHCSLMKPAADKLADKLAGMEFALPQTKVLHNVNVATSATTDEIKQALVEQLHQPVQWVKTIESMRDAGVTKLFEIGPGKVLAGLNRRIDKAMVVETVFDSATLAQAIEGL